MSCKVSTLIFPSAQRRRKKKKQKRRKVWPLKVDIFLQNTLYSSWRLSLVFLMACTIPMGLTAQTFCFTNITFVLGLYPKRKGTLHNVSWICHPAILKLPWGKQRGFCATIYRVIKSSLTLCRYPISKVSLGLSRKAFVCFQFPIKELSGRKEVVEVQKRKSSFLSLIIYWTDNQCLHFHNSRVHIASDFFHYWFPCNRNLQRILFLCFIFSFTFYYVLNICYLFPDSSHLW